MTPDLCGQRRQTFAEARDSQTQRSSSFTAVTRRRRGWARVRAGRGGGPGPRGRSPRNPGAVKAGQSQGRLRPPPPLPGAQESLRLSLLAANRHAAAGHCRRRRRRGPPSIKAEQVGAPRAAADVLPAWGLGPQPRPETVAFSDTLPFGKAFESGLFSKGGCSLRMWNPTS